MKKTLISYNNLWKLLIDRKMNKTDLQRATRLSSATITKLAKNETVNTAVLIRICSTLKCDTSDIMSIVEEPVDNVPPEQDNKEKVAK